MQDSRMRQNSGFRRDRVQAQMAGVGRSVGGRWDAGQVPTLFVYWRQDRRRPVIRGGLSLRRRFVQPVERDSVQQFRVRLGRDHHSKCGT